MEIAYFNSNKYRTESHSYILANSRENRLHSTSSFLFFFCPDICLSCANKTHVISIIFARFRIPSYFWLFTWLCPTLHTFIETRQSNTCTVFSDHSCLQISTYFFACENFRYICSFWSYFYCTSICTRVFRMIWGCWSILDSEKRIEEKNRNFISFSLKVILRLPPLLLLLIFHSPLFLSTWESRFIFALHVLYNNNAKMHSKCGNCCTHCNFTMCIVHIAQVKSYCTAKTLRRHWTHYEHAYALYFIVYIVCM